PSTRSCGARSRPGRPTISPVFSAFGGRSASFPTRQERTDEDEVTKLCIVERCMLSRSAAVATLQALASAGGLRRLGLEELVQAVSSARFARRRAGGPAEAATSG